MRDLRISKLYYFCDVTPVQIGKLSLAFRSVIVPPFSGPHLDAKAEDITTLQHIRNQYLPIYTT
jgi:hypothetical protein